MKLIDKLALKKDGITALIALVLLIVGGFQYFDVKLDGRISNSLEILERREKPLFVSARENTIRKWIDIKKANPALWSDFVNNKDYTKDIYDAVETEIENDEQYRKDLLSLGLFYQNASAFALDGHCDAVTLCSSLRGEMQDFLDLNKPYLIYAHKVRKEDATSIYLDVPEFVAQCDKGFFLKSLHRLHLTFNLTINLTIKILIKRKR